MSTATPRLNAIACKTCKARKVKCDRIIPQCTRCGSQHIDCVYPQREKKKPTKPSKDRTAELEALFNRLQRVENTIQKNGLPGHLQPQFFSGPSTAVHSPEFPTPQSLAAPTADGDDHVSPPQMPVHPGCTTRTFGRHQSVHVLLNQELDIGQELDEAVKTIAATRLRKLFHAAQSTRAIDIPPHLAKSWVKNFFDTMPTNMTSTLDEHQPLLELLPSLLHEKYIHIDPGIIICYYIILYHGCCLPDNGSGMPQESSFKYLEDTYVLALRSLPAWQRSATGTTVDLNAASLMTRAAVEMYDLELASQTHKMACEFAERLRIHVLDGPEDKPLVPRNDAERRRFWDLVQYDVYLRMITGNPSALSTPMRAWKTNLPYLGTELEAGKNTEPAIMFLFCSRITLDIAMFYNLLDQNPDTDRATLIPKVEEICQNMEDRYKEWQIDEVLYRTEITCANGWVVADAAIGGLMSAIWILRLIGVTSSPRLIRLCRHTLQVVDLILKQIPMLAILSMSFFSLMAFIPYVTLAEHLADGDDSVGDLELLERLRDVIVKICEEELDFVPLMRAMQHACEKARGGHAPAT